MCYLVAKKLDNVGSIALRTTHGKHLSQFKREIESEVGYDKIISDTKYTPYYYGTEKATFEQIGRAHV